VLNVGEQLVSSYLRHIRDCDFIQTNLYTIEAQGEIDVVGLNLKMRKVYVCEVAIHLTTGLQYVKNKRPNNIQKLTEKFSRDIEYVRKYLDKYEHHFMLWSPVVKETAGNPAYNQIGHLAQIGTNLQTKYGVTLECIVNEEFQACLAELRAFSAKQTAELQCPLMRLMQIEEHLDRRLAKATKQSAYRTR